MDASVKEMIRSQTMVQDGVLIERTFHECEGNVVKTILKLSNLTTVETKPTPTLFDEMRAILDAKDAILQEKIKESKGI